MKRLALLALIATACSPAASPSPSFATLTLKAGDPGPQTFIAGRYTVAWTSTCSDFSLEVAPTSGAAAVAIADHVSGSGSKVVDLPAGPAYVNRGGICPSGGDYVVTITPAASPS